MSASSNEIVKPLSVVRDIRDVDVLPALIAGVKDYAIFMLDPQGRVATWNAGAQRLKGYETEQIIGQHFSVLYPPEDVAAGKPERELETAASDGRLEDEGWRVRKDGSRFWAVVVITAIRGPDGGLIGYGKITRDWTERRAREVELAAAVEEAEIMRTAFSDAPGGVALLSMDGRFLRVNESLCEILGRPKEELVGLTSAGFTHPDDSGVTSEAFAVLRSGGARVSAEKRYLRPDGQVVWTSSIGTAVSGPDGELTHVVSHFRDVTAQRTAEALLRASEENLRTVAAVVRELPSHENPREAICAAAAVIAGADIVQLWEPDGDDHLRFTAAVGVDPAPDMRLPLTGEITGAAIAFHSGERQVFLDLYAPDTPVSAAVRDRLGAASSLCEPVTGRDGPLGVLVVVWKTAIIHTSAQVIDAVGLLATEAASAIERADLTVKVSAQAHTERLRLRQLLEGAPDAMIITDSDGLIQTVNDQTLRLLGCTREELIGETVDEFLPNSPQGRQSLDPAGLAAPPSAAGVERELAARRKDGREIPVEITLSPVQTDEGLLVMAAVRDITDRRAAEAALRAAEEQFRRSFDDAAIGMMIVDLRGRFIEVNDAFCEIVGHPRATLIGLPRQSITHPDDLAEDEAAVRRLLDGAARSFTREKRLLHAAGYPVWVSVNVALVRDAEDLPHHLIVQAQDITERREHETQLRHLADHDPLTGLLNRRSLERELANHVARVKRFGVTGAVLMIDLDNFKYYNDTQGHSAGDELILRTGRALQARLRETDVLVRLGGDEFAILLPQEDRESAGVVARDLLKLIVHEAPAPTHGEARRITASIGIACFSDGDQLTGEEIMVNADLAMYEAKENGRNQCAHYSTDEHGGPRIENQMKWASEITQALAEDRFELFAQPIESLHGGGLTQYELLLRMRDAHGDHIPPGTFLYIAERVGLIQEIDRWVVARAIDMLAEQRAQGRDLRFEVNLSGLSIGDPELLELIEQRLTETGVRPDRLIFEVTETAAIANIARAGAFAGRLAELGCRFALDDFGAGFGSFYYLKHLPFDYLKIDGEFVRHCATNPTDRTLIAAVVQIAQGMAKHTIAEFVSDQESVEVLTELGVDYGQGYFLGRPEPLAQHLAHLSVSR